MIDKKKKRFPNFNNLLDDVASNNLELKKDFDEIDTYTSMISSIISRRVELGLSQRDLAKLCDLPQSTIGRIEAGSTTGSIRSLIKLTKALGLSISIK